MKLETRNPKSETNPNTEIGYLRVPVPFTSNFEFRILNFTP
jgi:hypothetical protein